MSSVLNIGQSALLAAQIGVATTGHNIANAKTAGYNRQEVLQGAVAGQNMGSGFVGKGTEILSIKRIYNEYLSAQVNTSQTSSSMLNTYYTQVKQIDNMMGDSSVGLTPALTDFFAGVQDVSSAPSTSADRQSLLSTTESLVARFQSQASQLNEMRQGVNDMVVSTVGSINSYSQEIAALNDAIEKAMGRSDSQAPNDLLDMRDQKIAELSKEIQVTTVKQGNSYNVYVGNGQPLVVGTKTYDLAAVQSPTDPSKVDVAYNSNGTSFVLSENNIAGGNLAGLLEFRTKTLEPAQNELGRIATVLASTFNAQHELGQDLNGDLGQAFFNVGAPVVTSNTRNNGNAVIGASITNANALTASDYQLQLATSGNYVLTRLSDNKVLSSTTLAAAQTATANEGFSFSISSGTASNGDSFLIRPTVNGASGISLAISDTNKIAAAAPIATTATTTNTGTGKISAGVVNAPLNANLQQPVTITFTSATTFNVTGTGIVPPAGVGVAYTAGADITFNGWTVQLSGTPANGDTFTVRPNTGGKGDSRNALLLGALQTSNQVGGSTTYQGAYSKLVNTIGNKTSEMEVTSKAATAAYTQAVAAQQSESGVNLDEEAANLLRYQQAYQAAAKVMKAASDMFASLLAVM